LASSFPRSNRLQNTATEVLFRDRHPTSAAQADAATDGDTTELWAALQMVLMLENVEYRLK
jgi:hypothetical protein